MIVLACDPDTKCSGLALADAERVYAVGVANTEHLGLGGMAAAIEQANEISHLVRMFDHLADDPPDVLPRLTRFVVEAQQVYATGKANANNLLPLAMVAGGAALAGRMFTDYVRAPLPAAWKGQVPKKVHQKRILEHYGLDAKLSGVRVIGGPIPSTHLKEVIDAIGLAHWGATKA